MPTLSIANRGLNVTSPPSKTRANARIIDGRAIATSVSERVRKAVAALSEAGITLGLTVIRVGDDPSSKMYVRSKERAAAKVGISSTHLHLPASIDARELTQHIRELNQNDATDGILLQLPLPNHLVAGEHIEAIDPAKDVDGLHPTNLGHLMLWDAALRPCTPGGVLELLKREKVQLRGVRAVVVGRSVLVGRPTAQLLMKHDATVSICHRHTRDLASIVAQADVIVSATGVPHLIKGDWIKPGATVIDVGISRLSDGTLCGDVEFDAASKRAAAITPVPGGVGPMTIAMLLRNTVIAGMLRRNMRIDPEL